MSGVRKGAAFACIAAVYVATMSGCPASGSNADVTGTVDVVGIAAAYIGITIPVDASVQPAPDKASTCGACVQRANRTTCAGLVFGANLDSSFKALDACVSHCTLVACVEDCEATYPEGVQYYVNVVQCVANQVCSDQCTPQDFNGLPGGPRLDRPNMSSDGQYQLCQLDLECPDGQGCEVAQGSTTDGYCTPLCLVPSSCPDTNPCPTSQSLNKKNCYEQRFHRGAKGVCELFSGAYGPNTCFQR
jgi:hypothetical protein